MEVQLGPFPHGSPRYRTRLPDTRLALMGLHSVQIHFLTEVGTCLVLCADLREQMVQISLGKYL